MFDIAVLADEPDQQVTLLSEEGRSARPRSSVLSMFSFSESFTERRNPYDLTKYVDRVSLNSFYLETLYFRFPDPTHVYL